MEAVRGSRTPFLSVLGVPLLGVGALIFCLWNPQAPFRADAGAETALVLQAPDPRMDKTLSLCLRAQARQVALCRRSRPGSLAEAEAVAAYNLVARECTPAVFPATGLPASVGPCAPAP